jgi:hypothetical protein
VAGCGGGGAEEVEEAEAAETGHSTGVPERLAATESGAEDLIAAALSGDRDAVVSGAASLRKATGGSTAETLTHAGVPAAEVAELRLRTRRLARVAGTGSFVDVELAANAVSQLMPGLYRRFEPRVPAAILALDYLDREAQFRSLARQPVAVAVAVKKLARTWAQVRAKVVAAGGATEARAYQAHVAKMKRLSPSAAGEIQGEARRGLELVDRLENVFRQ